MLKRLYILEFQRFELAYSAEKWYNIYMTKEERKRKIEKALDVDFTGMTRQEVEEIQKEERPPEEGSAGSCYGIQAVR